MELEELKSRWETYSRILRRFNDQAINGMLEDLGERLCVAPANPRIEQYGCFPGGLIASQMEVLRLMRSLNEFHENTCDVKSVFKVALLHDIGRIGTADIDWLSEQDSDWHHERGFHFKASFDIPELTHVQRTLFFLQKYGVSLTEEEYMAILSVDDNNARNKLGSILLHSREMYK